MLFMAQLNMVQDSTSNHSFIQLKALAALLVMFQPLLISNNAHFGLPGPFQQSNKLKLVTIRIVKVNGHGGHPGKYHRLSGAVF